MSEFSHEKDANTVEQALVRLDVPYAVAFNNDYETWCAYGNHYWPSLYLIDKAGVIRYTHVGEGGYAETESVIQALLAEEWSGW